MDAAAYAHIFAVLKKHKAPALEAFFRSKAGCTNALTRMRGRKLALSEEAVAKLLIPGDFDEPAAEGEVREFERRCAVRLNDCLREARSDPFGPAALCSYINDKQKVDGWEEFKVPEEKYPLVIFVGDTKELELAEGEFIKIGEGDTVSFELISLK